MNKISILRRCLFFSANTRLDLGCMKWGCTTECAMLMKKKYWWPWMLPLKNTMKWLGFAKFTFKAAVKCFKKILPTAKQLRTEMNLRCNWWQLLEKWMVKCVKIASTYTLLHYNSIYGPFVPSAAGQAFLFWFYKRHERRMWYWLFKAAETSSIVKKIPLKSILMPFEENYELAATKLKGYSFRSSSFCHISYSKHQFFKKLLPEKQQ